MEVNGSGQKHFSYKERDAYYLLDNNVKCLIVNQEDVISMKYLIKAEFNNRRMKNEKIVFARSLSK